MPMMRVLSSKERRELIVLQSCGHHGQAKDHHHERDSSPSTISTTEKQTHNTMKKSSSPSHRHHKQPKEPKTVTHAPEEDEDVSSTSHTSSTCSSSQSSQAEPQAAPQQQEQRQQQSVFELTKLMEMKCSLHHHKDKIHNKDSSKAKKHTKKNTKITGKASLTMPSIHEHGGDNENENTARGGSQPQTESSHVGSTPTTTSEVEKIEQPKRKEKKSVSFYRKVKVRKISSHRRYTLAEREAQWYSEDDYVQIKNDCCFVVRNMMQVQKDEKKRQKRLARGSNVKKSSWRTKKTKKTIINDGGNVTGTGDDDGNQKDDYASDESYDEFECYEEEVEEQELRNDADDNDIEKVWRAELETVDQTIRGLENKTPHRANARQRKKIDIVWSVLDVQDHQIQKRALERSSSSSSEREQPVVVVCGGGDDDEDAAATPSDDDYDSDTTMDFEFHDRLSSLLSQVYVACNWKCRLDARRRGMQDEFCADALNQPVEHHQQQSQQHALSA